jgi:hypothetical protein
VNGVPGSYGHLRRAAAQRLVAGNHLCLAIVEHFLMPLN